MPTEPPTPTAPAEATEPALPGREEARPAVRCTSSLPAWLLPAVLIGLALVPLAASVAAIAPGWVPVGDDATVAMRGRDLFTADMPLVGMPSAVGEQTGRPVHHPGPLELWWVGAFVRALDFPQASLVAAALAWAAATTAALLLARRVGGTALMALAAVVSALLTWSLRGEVPVTPFNAHAIVVPLGAYLLALVAWHQRVRWAPLAAIVLGSWAAQAHLTAVGPVVAAGAVVAAAAWPRWRRTDERRPVDGRRVVVGLGVLALCWIGPILDVVLERGGNVRAVLGARSDLASEAIGGGTAVDIVVRALAWRPVWATAGTHPTDLVQPASAWHWISAGAVLAVAVAGGLRWRRTHPGLGLAVAASSAAIVVGAVLAARFPREYLSLLALHNHLWIWPLAAVLWGAALVVVGLEVARIVARPAGESAVVPQRAALALPAVAAVALVVVGASSVGAPHRNLNLADPPYVRALAEGAVDELEPDRAYRLVISGEFDTFFVEVGILHLLEHHGVEVVGPERYRRTFGDRRTDPRRPLGGELVVTLGWDPPARSPAGMQLLAVYEPSAALLEERQQAEDRLVEHLQATEGYLPLWAMRGTDDAEVRRWLREDLHGLVIARMVPEELARAPEARRYLALRREPSRYASLHLVPIPG